MGSLSGTFTLSGNYIIVQPTVSGVGGISNTTVGLIIQIGSDVSDWSVNDVVLFNNANAASFTNNSETFRVIDQATIYFKYVSPA